MLHTRSISPKFRPLSLSNPVALEATRGQIVVVETNLVDNDHVRADVIHEAVFVGNAA
jgi:hypothetical protein